MPRRALVVLIMFTALFALPRAAWGTDYNPRFAGWATASGLLVDEASAEFTVPAVSSGGSGLIDWVGLGGDSTVFQAGAGVDASAGVNGCWWADYPATNSVAIPGLRCAPGDVIFVDIAQAYYGWTRSRVVVVDVTTGQSSGWLSVYTPDLAGNPTAEFLVEANESLGAAPSSFAPISFQYATVVRGGYAGSGGEPLPVNGLAYFGLVTADNSLASVIPGVSLGADWGSNAETVYP